MSSMIWSDLISLRGVRAIHHLLTRESLMKLTTGRLPCWPVTSRSQLRPHGCTPTLGVHAGVIIQFWHCFHRLRPQCCPAAYKEPADKVCSLAYIRIHSQHIVLFSSNDGHLSTNTSRKRALQSNISDAVSTPAHATACLDFSKR